MLFDFSHHPVLKPSPSDLFCSSFHFRAQLQIPLSPWSIGYPNLAKYRRGARTAAAQGQDAGSLHTLFLIKTVSWTHQFIDSPCACCFGWLLDDHSFPIVIVFVAEAIALVNKYKQLSYLAVDWECIICTGLAGPNRAEEQAGSQAEACQADRWAEGALYVNETSTSCHMFIRCITLSSHPRV